MKHLSIANPVFNGNERKYILDCIDSTWISSAGTYITKFEDAFADYCDTKFALSVSNGTVALHLILLGLGIGPGDEVIVPTFTFVATANCVHYCGATPVFVDCTPDTWCIDPSLIEKKISPRTKAVIAVHLYGHPCDMDPILALGKKYNVFVIEDAAEAHGAEYKGRKVGGISVAASFSFFGNKIITTGEGGMVTTNDSDLAAKMRLLKGQGMDPNHRYWFPMVGYNFRMTNLAAAIGLGQLENIDWHLAQRRRVQERYLINFKNVPELKLQPELPGNKNSYWMVSVLFTGNGFDRDKCMRLLHEAGIETRPFFYPMHVMPVYGFPETAKEFPVADRISKNGMNVPSHALLSDNDIDYICENLLKALSRCISA